MMKNEIPVDKLDIMLTMMRVDLKVNSLSYNERFKQYIEFSKINLEKQGIHFNFDDVADLSLIVWNACFLWSKRNSEIQTIPRPLKFAISNRIFSDKGNQNG